MNVENAPFLVTKLKIQILPCVLTFVGGKGTDRIVGFEGLGFTPDTFATKDLEARLLRSGVILRAKLDTAGTQSGMKATKKGESDEDDDDD